MSLQVAPNRTGTDLTSLITNIVSQILEALNNPPVQVVSQGDPSDSQGDAWNTKITDGSKYATLTQGIPGNSDPALVVALSPNTPFPIPPSVVQAIVNNAVQQIADQSALGKVLESLNSVLKELRIIRTGISFLVNNDKAAPGDLDPANPDFDAVN